MSARLANLSVCARHTDSQPRIRHLASAEHYYLLKHGRAKGNNMLIWEKNFVFLFSFRRLIECRPEHWPLVRANACKCTHFWFIYILHAGSRLECIMQFRQFAKRFFFFFWIIRSGRRTMRTVRPTPLSIEGEREKKKIICYKLC